MAEYIIKGYEFDNNGKPPQNIIDNLPSSFPFPSFNTYKFYKCEKSLLILGTPENTWTCLPLLKLSTNSEMYVRYKIVSADIVNTDWSFSLGFSWNSNLSNYCVVKINNAPSTSGIQLKHQFATGSSGTVLFPTTELSTSVISNLNNTFINIRLNKTGTTYKYKLWLNDVNDEPSSWSASTSFTTKLNTGGLILVGGYQNVLLDFVSVVDDSTTASKVLPTSKLNGLIKDKNGNLLANKEIRFYDNRTGILLYKTVSNENGIYDVSLELTNNEIVDIIVYDGSKNFKTEFLQVKTFT